MRLINASEHTWNFAVSDYSVISKWLKARVDESLQGAEGVALLRGALDLVRRVKELLPLCDKADAGLVAALPSTLTRDALELPDTIFDVSDDYDEPA